MKIGIFSTFIESAALDLVKTVQDAIKTGEIPNSEITFIFSNRAKGDNPTTDQILEKLTHQDIPLTTFSAARFKPDMRKKGRQEEKNGNLSVINDWRKEFGSEVLSRLPKTDIDLLLGDMYIWGDNMCRERKGINLHPALPNGPKGEWYKVIWQLIQEGAQETGVMMHKVTPELDRGPAVTFCSFPIRGYQFDSLWNQLPQDQEELAQLIKLGLSEKEKTSHPLHNKIREHGLTREFALIIQTAKSFAEGDIRIEGESILDRLGKPLQKGYDLTKQIDEIVRPTPEGNIVSRREVKI